MSRKTNILILGNHRNALTVARRLGKHFRVILGAAGGEGRVERSRFVAETLSLPCALDDEFPDALESHLQCMSDSPVLFPIGDVELYGLLRVPSVIEGKVRTVMPAPDVVSKCLDKGENLDLAHRLRVPQASYRKVTCLSELQDAVRDVGCPCIIKSGHQLSLAFGKKAYHVESESDLDSLISENAEPQHGLVVQAVAKGVRHNVYFAADNGRVVGAMEARVVRTTIHDGSGFTVESESVTLNDTLRDHTERLVEQLGYHGIGNTQFLVDRHYREISFLEISPRLGAAFAVTVPCGFDFAHAGLCLALGDTPDPQRLPRDYPSGRRLAWSYGDLAGLINAAKGREIRTIEAARWLGRACRSAVTADIHTTWTWQDPLPTLAISATAFRKLW